MSRRTRPPVGVIAGTGVAEHFEISAQRKVRTEFGEAAAYVARDGTFYVLPRHGLGHDVPPHMINYRANISCLHRLGVRKIIATSAVGSMDPKLKVGELGLAAQFLDFTRGRHQTFFDTVVRHTDVTNPYSTRLNDAVKRAADELHYRIRKGLVYVCVDGPRFETAAEIRMFRKLGGDVVGMTGVPEAVLAKEIGMEYSAILIATNWAAGIQRKVSHAEVIEQMKRNGPKVKGLIMATVRRLGGSASS